MRTVYTANYATLPVLVGKAREWSAAERTTPLFLAGAIVAKPVAGRGVALTHRLRSCATKLRTGRVCRLCLVGYAMRR